ncbi:MAG: electron transport complex subunit RsxC [Candidatus Saelkia tenebricola]|nr:electron transport complex subunit RsxC [Candidatus Saelkia tenebricola]
MSNLKTGIHIKDDTILNAPFFKGAFIPKKVILPLSQHTGKPSQELAEKGQVVEAGEEIASSGGFISSNLHASISGKVEHISDYFHPITGKGKSIFIEGNDRTQEWSDKKESAVDRLSIEELTNVIKQAGIVGLGGAAFPTHVKLQPPEGVEIETLLINGCECEPFLSSDDVLMRNNPFQIIKGIQIIQKIINPKRVIIVIEDNKQEALERMRQAVLNKNIEVIRVKTKYPQGAEKQLINTVLNKEVPPGKLPFNVGVIVQNVATCFAVYEAVYKDKPLIERYVTISGDCIENSGVYLVRIGTLVSDLVENLGGIKKDVGKIVFGGPMMGLAQASMEMPILKGTSGVLLLSGEFAKLFKEYPCIKCSRCVDVCSMNLLPTKIAHFTKHGKIDLAKEYNISDCIECGSCEYVCPSRIPLTQYIRIGKQLLLEKKSE